MKKTYAVIGLGRFGTAVAERLYALGNEVLVIDDNAERVQKMESRVTYAVVADARDEEVLRSLAVRNYDCAVVAIGSDLAASIVITMNLKELGVPQVICKAEGDTQKRALEKIGADKVLIPEREAGVKLAQAVTSSSILDFIELSDEYGIAEVQLPAAWVGKSIRELNIRAKYGVNIIAIRENGKINVVPDANEPLAAGCVLVTVGANDKLTRLKG